MGGPVFHPQYTEVMAPGFLEGVEAKSLVDIRAMRSRCEQVEAAVSFGRRVLHGRLDLLESDLDRRRAGKATDDLGDLVNRMPSILRDVHGRPASSQHRPVPAVPAECVDERMVAVLDAVAGPATLSHLGELGDAELQRIAERLRELERQLSQARRSLHEVIDVLQQEISARYQRGEASVDSLLA
jgi:hypothetical protein